MDGRDNSFVIAQQHEFPAAGMKPHCTSDGLVEAGKNLHCGEFAPENQYVLELPPPNRRGILKQALPNCFYGTGVGGGHRDPNSPAALVGEVLDVRLRRRCRDDECRRLRGLAAGQAGNGQCESQNGRESASGWEHHRSLGGKSSAEGTRFSGLVEVRRRRDELPEHVAGVGVGEFEDLRVPLDADEEVVVAGFSRFDQSIRGHRARDQVRGE